MSSSWCCPCLSRRPKKAVVESAPATAEKKVVENDVAEKDTSQRLAAFAPEHDREHHVVQWNRAIRRHFGRLKKPQTQQLLLDLCDNTDLESSLAYLQKEYEDHGVVAAFGNLEGSFGAINSFSTALSSIAQAGNQPGQVLWGSFLLLINVSPHFLESPEDQHYNRPH